MEVLSSITLNQTNTYHSQIRLRLECGTSEKGTKCLALRKQATKLVLWDALLTWQFCDSVICSRTVGGVRCLSGVCGFSFSAHQTPHCVQNYSLHSLHMLPFDAVL